MGRVTKTDGGFCEMSTEGLIKEPLNTWSSFSFILVGLLIAWKVMCGSFKNNANLFTKRDFMPIFFSSLVVCLGPCSMAKHASHTGIGDELDMLSMYLICGFMIAYGTQRFFHLGVVYFTNVFVLVIGVCEWISHIRGHIPIVGSPDNLIFAVFITLSVLIEVLILFVQQKNMRKRWGILSLVTLMTAFLIWNFSTTGAPLCNPRSLIQGHALWHLLDALALFFLFRFYVSEQNSESHSDQINLINECHYKDELTIT
jgi:hypothetical protein